MHDDSVYSQVATIDLLGQVVMYLSLLGLVAGLFIGRFIGVEMVAVVQIAYLGLAIITHLNPLLSPLTKMTYVNSINSMFSTDTVPVGLPTRFQAVHYREQLAYSLNYSVALLLLPLIAGLVLFIASKISKANQEKLCTWALLAAC